MTQNFPYFDWYSFEETTESCNCGSYLIIKNKAGEACVCGGILKRNDKGCYQSHMVGDYVLYNYVAGNLSSLNPVQCHFDLIGKKRALICLRVEFNHHAFIIFYSNKNTSISPHNISAIKNMHLIKKYYTALNAYGEIGDLEKDILNLYNSKVAPWSRCALSAVGFSEYLCKYFGYYSQNPFYLRPLEREEKYFPLRNIKEFNELMENNISFTDISIFNNRDRLEENIRLIDDLQITNSSVHRIEFDDYGRVEIVTPINWYHTDYRHDYDGRFERHHGKRKICRLSFCHDVLFQNFKKKFFEECEKLGISIEAVSNNVYEFHGSINHDFEEDDMEVDNYYEYGFELNEW